jgi:hypothetical protein
MTRRAEATSWPFVCVSAQALGPKLTKAIKEWREAQYDDYFYDDDEEDDHRNQDMSIFSLDSILHRRNRSGRLESNLHKMDAIAIFGLMCAAQGCDLQGGLFKSYSFDSVGHLISRLDINRTLIAFPALDIKQLILEAGRQMFATNTKQSTAAIEWFDEFEVRKEEIAAMDGYCYLSSENSLSSFLRYGALAFYTGFNPMCSTQLPFSHYDIVGLVDLSCPVEQAKQSLTKLQQYKATATECSKYWNIADYQALLIDVVAPLAILMGQAPEMVAQRVEVLIRFMWTELHEFTDSVVEFDANIRVAQMTFLWNYPELWSHLGLVPADMLGVDVTHALLRTSGEGEREDSTTMRAFWRVGLIPKDGTDASFGKLALKQLGKKHGLFDPKMILRRWGTCNPSWFKSVKDFAPAIDEINFLMERGAWHYVLEKDRVSHLFGEKSALEAIRAFITTGGAADLLRAKKSLEKYPHLLEQSLKFVTKGSEASRLPALASLTSDQISLVPPGLHEHILAADLGL